MDSADGHVLIIYIKDKFMNYIEVQIDEFLLDDLGQQYTLYRNREF